jgi:hypothetical protein
MLSAYNPFCSAPILYDWLLLGKANDQCRPAALLFLSSFGESCAAPEDSAVISLREISGAWPIYSLFVIRFTGILHAVNRG